MCPTPLDPADLVTTPDDLVTTHLDEPGTPAQRGHLALPHESTEGTGAPPCEWLRDAIDGALATGHGVRR